MSNQLEVVYTPDSELRRPRQFLRQLGRDLLASRELAAQLLLRNLRAQYRQSLLGYGWAVLPPLITTLTWAFLNAANLLNVGQTGVPYPVFVLAGSVLWQGFLDALNTPLNQFTENQRLLAKVNFPREALILAGLGEVIVYLTIRLGLVLGLLMWYRLAIPATVLLALAGILALLSLGLMLGLLLAPLGMLYHDVPRALSIATTLWFFVTPIAYLPPTKGTLAVLVRFNPLTPLVVTTRAWLTTGETVQLAAFLAMAGLAISLLFVAWIMARLAIPHFVERMAGSR